MQPSWEYGPLQRDGSMPHCLDLIKTGHKLAELLNAGEKVVFVAGGHVGGVGGSSFKYKLVDDHPATVGQDACSTMVYAPINTKQRILFFKQIPTAMRIFNVIIDPSDAKSAAVHNSFTGDHVLDVQFDADWSMKQFKDKIKAACVRRNLFSYSQPISVDVLHHDNNKVKNIFKLDGKTDGQVKKRRLA